MSIFRPDLHVLTGAYSVDAVDDETELSRFEHHLERCQQCAGEVRDLTEVTTRLAFAAAVAPPPLMRHRVLEAVARIRQLPPVLDRTPRSSWWQGRAPLLLGTVAAAAAAAVVVLALVLAQTRGQLDQARSKDAALAAVLAAPDARASTSPASVGGTATVVYSLALHSVIVTSASLPTPPAGRVYELWLIGPPRVRAAGFLSASPGGRSSPVLVSGLRRGDELGLTIEPVGGTRQPTTNPILVLRLRA